MNKTYKSCGRDRLDDRTATSRRERCQFLHDRYDTRANVYFSYLSAKTGFFVLFEKTDRRRIIRRDLINPQCVEIRLPANTP